MWQSWWAQQWQGGWACWGVPISKPAWGCSWNILQNKNESIEIIFYLLQYLTVGVGTPQCAGLCRVFVYPPLLLPWVSSPFSIGRGKLRVNVIVWVCFFLPFFKALMLFPKRRLPADCLESWPVFSLSSRRDGLCLHQNLGVLMVDRSQAKPGKY